MPKVKILIEILNCFCFNGGTLIIKYADVMELVDVPDSKSGVGNYVSVRPRPSANKRE